MWRRRADGEIYAYLPEKEQRKDLCDEKGNICNPNYGYSLGRGSWKFKTGEWIKVRQTVKLNRPDRQDGIVKVHVNDKLVYNERSLVFVSENTSKIIGVGMYITRLAKKLENKKQQTIIMLIIGLPSFFFI